LQGKASLASGRVALRVGECGYSDDATALPGIPLVTPPAAPDVAPAATPAASESNVEKTARRAMEKHLPAYVIADRNHDVLMFSGETETYLGPSPGTASLNLFSLVRKPLRAPARSALQTVLATQAMVRQREALDPCQRELSIPRPDCRAAE
jgi:hypothetical protein